MSFVLTIQNTFQCFNFN